MDEGEGDDEEANGDGEDGESEGEDVQSIIPTSDSREEELENEKDMDDDGASNLLLFPDSPSLLPDVSFVLRVDSVGLVECPLCFSRVKLEAINTHIDNGCRLEPLLPNGIGSRKTKFKSNADVKGQWSKIMSGVGGGNGGSMKTKAKAKGKEKLEERCVPSVLAHIPRFNIYLPQRRPPPHP